MASKQTRRSISVSGTLYDRLRSYCDENQTSMSAVVEERIREALGMEAREEARPKPSASTPPKTEAKKPAKVSPIPQETKWVPPIKLPERIEKIKEVVEAKKEEVLVDPIAAKIFTF